MRRLLTIATALLIGFAVAIPARADGMPEPTSKTVKVIKKKVHRVRVWRAPAPPRVVALPGPYDLRPYPPPPLDSAYEPAMVEYFRDPSITGYWPGSAAGCVHDSTALYVAAVCFERTGWPGYRAPHLPPPAVDNFPFRLYRGADVYEYDGVIGQYVKLASADATAAIAVRQEKPLPLLPAPAR